jgi:hypothetical protein
LRWDPKIVQDDNYGQALILGLLLGKRPLHPGLDTTQGKPDIDGLAPDGRQRVGKPTATYSGEIKALNVQSPIHLRPA